MYAMHTIIYAAFVAAFDRYLCCCQLLPNSQLLTLPSRPAHSSRDGHSGASGLLNDDCFRAEVDSFIRVIRVARVIKIIRVTHFIRGVRGKSIGSSLALARAHSVDILHRGTLREVRHAMGIEQEKKHMDRSGDEGFHYHVKIKTRYIDEGLDK
jgi:hypothetical protein